PGLALRSRDLDLLGPARMLHLERLAHLLGALAGSDHRNVATADGRAAGDEKDVVGIVGGRLADREPVAAVRRALQLERRDRPPRLGRDRADADTTSDDRSRRRRDDRAAARSGAFAQA